MVRDLVDVEAALVTTNLLNSIGSLGALVIDPVRGTGTPRVRAGVTVGSLDRIARRFAVGAAVQVPEAASAARLLGDVAGGQVHVSRHRGAAARVDEQDPLGFDQLVASAGRARSRWDDGSLVRAQEDLGQGAMAGRIVVSDHAFSMPIPFAHDAAYLQAVTTEAHPILGHGLMVRLSLPDGATEHADAATAAELNRLEVDSWSRAHLMGAWVAQSGRIHHVAFHPNLASHGEGDASSILRCGVRRAHWSADVLG